MSVITYIKREEGFTVVEVIVSVVVAGIFIIVMSTAVSSLNSLNARAEKLSIANGIAEAKIEELRSGSFLSLPSDGTVVDFTLELPDILPDPTSAEYTVTDISSSTKRVDVSVQYDDFKNNRVLVFSTVIGELGVGQY